MGCHIPLHRGCLSFICSLLYVVSCMTFDPQSCISCLGGLFASVSNVCLLSSQPTICLIWSHRYCSADISVAYICSVFLCDESPIFVTNIVYECPLWSLLLGSTMTICIHKLPSSFGTATLDPVEKTEVFFEYHCPYIYFDGPCITHHHYLCLYSFADKGPQGICWTALWLGSDVLLPLVSDVSVIKLNWYLGY